VGKSRAVFLAVLLAGMSLNLLGAPPNTPRNPKLRSAAAVVQDQRTGELLLTKQAEIAMPIASLTKLITAMVVLDAHLDMEKVITIEEADKDRLRHSHSHLYVGTQLTRGHALLLALMASENRAAHSLARNYPGGVGALVAAMNEKARALELTDTRFEDPTGLSEGNISSARDLSRIVNKAYQYPQICAFSTQKEFTLQQGKRQLHFVNTNTLIRSRKWNIGLSKTGYIEEAGKCLVMQTTLAQRPIIIVLLNSNGTNSRQGDANRIKQWLEGSGKVKRTKSGSSKQ
jgi:serine-type D-Ala-D-Ala endopeptidase (penicillin-binding protein 7)